MMPSLAWREGMVFYGLDVVVLGSDVGFDIVGFGLPHFGRLRDSDQN
jgi:hypothetical protein